MWLYFFYFFFQIEKVKMTFYYHLQLIFVLYRRLRKQFEKCVYVCIVLIAYIARHTEKCMWVYSKLLTSANLTVIFLCTFQWLKRFMIYSNLYFVGPWIEVTWVTNVMSRRNQISGYIYCSNSCISEIFMLLSLCRWVHCNFCQKLLLIFLKVKLYEK